MMLVPGLLTAIGNIHLAEYLPRFGRGELDNDETMEDNLPWGVVCLAVLIMNRKCHASPLVPHAHAVSQGQFFLFPISWDYWTIRVVGEFKVEH